jgi:hypothetical protein
MHLFLKIQAYIKYISTSQATKDEEIPEICKLQHLWKVTTDLDCHKYLYSL